MQLLPNTSLQEGKYIIKQLLGQGGFGNTYIAYNTEFEETVAIIQKTCLAICTIGKQQQQRCGVMVGDFPIERTGKN